MSTDFSDSLTSVQAKLSIDGSKVLGSTYGSYRKLTQQEIDNAYASGFGIARAIVDRPANDMFRKWREWQAEAADISKIEKVEKRLKLKAAYARAQRYARKDGKAYIFIDDGRDATKSLTIAGGGEIRKVVMLKKSEVAEGDIDSDVMSEFYGLPVSYQLTGASDILEIHPSRMIMFKGDEAAKANGWAVDYDSVLARCFDSTRAYEMVAMNVADLTTEAKVDIVKVAGLSQIAQTPEGEQTLVKRGALLSQLKSSRGTVLLDKENEEWDQKRVSFATLPDIIDAMQIAVSGSAGIPRALLFGVTEGGMGSTGNLELSNYYDTIEAMQSDVGSDTELLDMLVVKTALGSVPDDVHYNWSPLWQESTETRTQNGERIAKLFGEVVSKQILSADMVAEPLVNALTEAGVAPGLEAVYAEWVAGGGEIDGDADDKIGGFVVGDAAPRSLYVYRKIKNAKEIYEWAKSQGFTDILDPSDMHVTICYSRQPIDWMSVHEDWTGDIEINGGARLLDKFGDNGEAKVLLFKSEGVEWRHSVFIEAGASYDFSEYQPHITISYGDMPDDAVPYTGRILLGPEVFEEVNDDWRGK